MIEERRLTPDETTPDDDTMPSDADVEDTPLEDIEHAADVTDAGDVGV